MIQASLAATFWIKWPQVLDGANTSRNLRPFVYHNQEWLKNGDLILISSQLAVPFFPGKEHNKTQHT